MVDKKKTQHYNYTHEAIPVLFHSQYDGMMTYLERDRTRFLEFWWKHVGDQLDRSLCSSPKGLNFEVREYDGNKKLLVVTFPEPQNSSESYFLAGLKLPNKRIPMVKWPTTRVVLLEKNLDEHKRESTWMCYITPQVRNVAIGPGPKPDKELFIDEVRKILKF